MSKLYHAFRLGIKNFLADDCLASGAAIAFYTTVALPPLLVMVFLIGDSLNVSRETLEQTVRDQLGMPTAAQLEGGLSGLAAHAQETSSVGDYGWPSKLLGLAVIVISASGVLAQLQAALNRVWEVKPDPAQGGWKNFVLKRLLSFAMLVVFAFLLLSSLMVTALFDEILDLIWGEDPGGLGTFAAYLADLVTALLISTLLFGAAYKILPDARMAWRDVWIGALLTAVMFVAGKSLLGWWLNRAAGSDAWGAAAASMIAMLSWVYYNSLVVLFGAEVTQAWAVRYGEGISAEPGAKRKRSPEKAKNAAEEDRKETEESQAGG